MVKFLIIRFSSIGDIVLATPVVRCLKNQLENAEIHFLTKPGFAEILSANPYISKIHHLSDNLNDTVHALKKENFDYVIDLHNNIRSINIKRALKRMYFTVDKLNMQKWILVNFKINKLPELHIVDRYLQTTKLFNVQNDQKGLDYFIPEKEQNKSLSLPKDYKNGYGVLVLGAMHKTKRLPLEKLIDLAGRIEFPLILIGGKEDKTEGDSIVKALKNKNIYNGCAKWSISGSASIIKDSRCVITHDTGMMHISAAFKKKIITIWGNTIPQFGMSAYLPDPASLNFEVENLSCRPCSKIGKKSCPKKHFKCMIDQDIERIASTANKLYLSN